MARILITGGAGFIGTNLARELLQQNHEVWVLDDFSSGLKSNIEDLDITVFEESILKISRFEDDLKSVDHIFHLAARGSVPRSIDDPRGTFETNAIGTYEVLEISRKLKIPITFSSSSSVYGKNTISPKSENSWTSPLSPYAASKLSAESLVLAFGNSYAVPNKIFRFFNVFGPFQRPNHLYSAVIPKWIWLLMNGNSITLEGDGNQSRDFTYVGDVVKILVQSLNRTDHANEVVNLAFGKQVTLLEIINLLRRKFPRVELTETKERISDIRHSLNNPKRLHELYPQVFCSNFEESLEQTISWLVSNQHKIRSQ